MQTTKQRCIELLTERGLWPDEAEAVLEQAKPSLEVGDHKMAWDRPADEYPTQLYAVMLMILKREAVKWIDANQPQHWARSMFAS